MITIIKTEISNSYSVQKSLARIGYKSLITNKKDDIKNATMIILPGVGSFDALVRSLEDNDLISILSERVKKDLLPTLGICLGMHVMTKKSEEGSMKGLGFIDAEVKKFNSSQTLKVPHFGWNSVEAKNTLDLTKNCNNSFYFAHSYYVECEKKENILLSTTYGINFCSAFINNNIIGVQFHPEKSNKSGLKLLENIMRYFDV